MKKNKEPLRPIMKDLGSGSFLFVFLRNLGTEDVKQDQEECHDKVSGKKEEGIRPRVQFPK